MDRCRGERGAMKSSGRPAGSVHPEGEADEGLLARCIERFGELGPRAADEVASGDAALAARLRQRLSALERLGLLGGTDGGTPLAIGRWRVLAPLGQGGMGSVYLAVGGPPRPGRTGRTPAGASRSRSGTRSAAPATRPRARTCASSARSAPSRSSGTKASSA
jgi:hypothetical protein